jgi:UDP-N-acetylmuramoyl-tripeptide--D-alanyl-D-alanine ligase
MKINQLYQIYLAHPVICTDTRKIESNSIFFALRGENFDANTFAKQALQAGAAYAVIDNADYAKGERYILVDDVLTALQSLAQFHRTQLSIPVIGLTGSNGKTTTKELLKAVLSQRFKVYATQGNLNNHIGVPLTILNINSNVELAVIEMGANHQKEIEFLCSIAQPSHGLISNVGMAHLDGFGGFEGVKRGKAELYKYLASHKGTIFVNASNKDLMEMLQQSAAKKVLYYQSKHRNMVFGTLLQSDPLIAMGWDYLAKHYEVQTNLTGAYNFDNILAAISVGCAFNLSADEINNGLATYVPTNNRSQIQKTENNTLICDFYNANPSSMCAAINNLASLKADKKIAVLGDMFELGAESAEQHKQIVELAVKQNFDGIVFVGEQFGQFEKLHAAHFFATRDKAAEYIHQQNWKDALILVKGSRGMALEKLLPYL